MPHRVGGDFSDSGGAGSSSSPAVPFGRSPTLQRVQAEAKQKASQALHGKGRITKKSRQLSKQEREKAMSIMARAYLKNWLSAHGQHLRPPKLHSSVMRVITAWFELVDEDGSGGLDGSELAAALKAAGLPCDEQSIVEMISLMDLNRDNEISWTEFEDFLAHEFAAGKALLGGEYILPSGTALPFGAMVSKMRRDRIMQDVFKGGERRQKWSSLAEDETRLAQELHLLANAQAEQVAFRRKTMLKAALGDCAYNNEEDEKEQEDQEQEARPGAGGEGEVHAEDEEDRATGSTRLSAHDESPVPEGHGQAPAPAMPLPRLNEATEPSPPADVSSHPASLDHGAQGEGHGVAASRAGTPTQGEGRDTLGPLSPRSRLNSCPPRPGTQEYRNRISVATQRATRLLDNLAGGGGGAGPTSDPLDGTDGTARLSSPGAAAGEGAPAAASNLLVLGHSDGGADAPTEHHAAHLPRVPPHAAAAPPPRALTGGLTASILQRTIARDLGLVPAPSAGDRLRAAMFTAAVPPHPYHAPQPHGCVSKEGSIAGQAGGGDTARAAKRETALAVLREHNLVELFSAIAAHDAPAPATGDIDAQLPQQSSGQRLPVLLPPVSPSSPCLPSLGAASLSGRGAAAAATGQLHHSGSENNLTLHVLQHMQHHPHPQQHHTHPHPQQGHKPQRGPPPQAPPDAHGEEGGAAHSAPLVTLKPRPSLVLPAEPPLLQGPASCSLVPGGGAGVAGHLASLRAHSGSGPLQLLKLRPHDLNASLGAARPPRESQGSPTPQGSAGRSVWERLTSETRRSAIGSTMSLEQVIMERGPGALGASAAGAHPQRHLDAIHLAPAGSGGLPSSSLQSAFAPAATTGSTQHSFTAAASPSAAAALAMHPRSRHMRAESSAAAAGPALGIDMRSASPAPTVYPAAPPSPVPSLGAAGPRRSGPGTLSTALSHGGAGGAGTGGIGSRSLKLPALAVQGRYLTQHTQRAVL